MARRSIAIAIAAAGGASRFSLFAAHELKFFSNQFTYTRSRLVLRLARRRPPELLEAAR